MAPSLDNTSLRKAAVLIRSLDGDSAARLLARLAPHEAHALRAALREVGAVDETELSGIAAELQQTTRPSPSKQSAVVLQLSAQATAGKAHEREQATFDESRLNCQLADLRKLAASANSPSLPFHILVETDPRSLGCFLEREHVQTVAVVLSYLPAKKAAEVLDTLREERQAEIIQRLLELGDTDPESLRVVEHSLEQWLVTQRREQLRHADRLAIVRSILDATQDNTRQTILLRLGQQDDRLARQIESPSASESSSRSRNNRITRPDNAWLTTPKRRDPKVNRAPGATDSASAVHAAGKALAKPVAHQLPKPGLEAPSNSTTPTTFAFDDLAELSIKEISAVLRVVEPEVMRCALIGASDRLLERLNQALPRPQRKQFQNHLRAIGPTRLSDVEAAQQVIGNTVSRMIEQGVIEPPVRITAQTSN